ncbi:MAG: AbgT family transporter [Bacteroidales bacterium]|nr:AbgT family transporter [Bacteroidales bacterium]
MKKFPHTYAIVFTIAVIATILTWIIPAGEYKRIKIIVGDQEKNIIDPHSFKYVEKNPQTIELFTSFYQGFVNQSHIIIFILTVGGVFSIINTTNAINAPIQALIKKLSGKKSQFFLLSTIFIIFSLFGAIFGMSEETLAFVAIFVSICIILGFDSIVGVSISYLAAHVGFASAFLNPFTVGIAQGLSGLPLFSGIGYRIFCWIVITTIALFFVLFYMAKIKKNNSCSLMHEIDKDWDTHISEVKSEDANNRKKSSWFVFILLLLALFVSSFIYVDKGKLFHINNTEITILHVLTIYFLITGYLTLKKSKEYFSLNLLIITVFFLIIGVIFYEWYIKELCGLFFASGIVIGIAYGLSINGLIKKFLDGCKDIISAAIVVGLAGGIIVILNDAKIIDTILYYVSSLLKESGKLTSLGIIYIMQNILNIIIPSGSAKAALTIPITSEFVDLIGIPRQLNVLAFQFGDGFTNFITPTSGVLLGALSIAKIPYYIWFKYIWKLVIILILIGFVLLIPPLLVNIKGF